MLSFDCRKVLVLNKSWTAIGIISLPRAILMLFKTDINGYPKAEVVDDDCLVYNWAEWESLPIKENEEVINSSKKQYRIPKIIKLNKYDKIGTYAIKFNRRVIYKRDNNKCQYCRQKFPVKMLNLDHLVPRSAGGLTSWTNCYLSCIDCNAAKGDRMPTKTKIMLNGKPVTMYTVYFASGKKSWSVTVQEPSKPKNISFLNQDIQYSCWNQWLGNV